MTERQLEKRTLVACFAGLAVLAAAGERAVAEDWPTYRHDIRRSGTTSERLDLPLGEKWRHVPRHAPRPAWAEPAGADLWHNLSKLSPAVIYDRTFHVASVSESVFFASSADDSVTCLDAKTGKTRWSFHVGGPIRLAPSISKGRAYFGSDDGAAYCIDAASGKLIWRFKPADRHRIIPGNGRLISAWPIRSGVLVDGGVAYFFSGLFPTEGVRLFALRADDGSVMWQSKCGSLSPQGYIVASPSRLYAPTGRTSPAAFLRKNGKRLGFVNADKGEGGSFALLAEETLIHGPGENGRMTVAGAERADRIAGFGGLRLIATSGTSYLQTHTELVGFDRKRYVEHHRMREALEAKRGTVFKKYVKLGRRIGGREGKKLRAELKAVVAEIKKLPSHHEVCKWKQPCEHRYSLILADEVLFAGGQGEVAAYAVADGKRVWTAKVDGKAYGLAVANGRLLVSTSTGAIHCFAKGAGAKPSVIVSKDDPSPYPADDASRQAAMASKQAATVSKRAAVTARRVLAKAGVGKGYCLMLGCGDGRLVREIARQSELRVVGVEPDQASVRKARATLTRAGLYGSRVAVHHGPLDKLPYADGVANLIVCNPPVVDGKIPVDPSEVVRLLRPGGGVAFVGRASIDSSSNGDLGRALDGWSNGDGGGWRTEKEGGVWAVCRRAALSKSGQWTHIYADPANTSCSGDREVGGPMRIQWFGGPGARSIVDRHHRNVPPLVRDGRAFVPGDNQIIAVDVYNGTKLWELDVPNSRRLGAPFDAGNMALAEDLVYLAVEDKCIGLDVATGRRKMEVPVPQLVSGQQSHWGYVGLVGDRLFGSGRKPKATYTEISRGADAYQWGDKKRMVTSDYLFCCDRHSGKVLWTYKSGVIVNPSMAIGDERVYFAESHNPKAADDSDGQVEMRDLQKGGLTLVALDSKTGKLIWKQKPDLSRARQILYLLYSDGTLVAFGTYNKSGGLWFEAVGFDASTGEERWRRTAYTGWRRGGTHGEQVRHPVIVGGTIYAEAKALDLRTGEPVGGWRFNHDRRACGTVTASASSLFFRDGNPMVLDLANRRAASLNRVSRPGCWVNIIPAGGVVVAPEGSSGCTCGYPIQASFAFSPRAGIGRPTGVAR